MGLGCPLPSWQVSFPPPPKAEEQEQEEEEAILILIIHRERVDSSGPPWLPMLGAPLNPKGKGS